MTDSMDNWQDSTRELRHALMTGTATADQVHAAGYLINRLCMALATGDLHHRQRAVDAMNRSAVTA